MTVKLKREIDIELFATKASRLFAEEVRKLHRNCVTCEHFDKRSETCDLNKMRPPAEIISYGCECYDEEIPF